MIVLPAIDLRDGACVQLVGGDYADERVRRPDPVAVLDQWLAAGFTEIHLVDLDAATRRGSNRETIAQLLARSRSDRPPVRPSARPAFQVAGGIDSFDRVSDLLVLGAERLVVGTQAIEDPDWLARLTGLHPDKIVVAADVRGRSVVTRGWTAETGRDVVELVRGLDPLPLGGILVTAVHLEGKLQGPDLGLVADVVAATRHPIQASGGIRNLDDLHALARAGATRSVVGMALYTGVLDGHAVVQEFSS